MSDDGRRTFDTNRDGHRSAAGAVEHRPRRGRKRERGSMVPAAEFTSYYGRPIIKTPTWKSPDVPVYLWVGGMAGASSVLFALAGETDRPALRRGGRLVAAGGAALGTVALIHDLGRPARFLHMLRVIKPTSPLSIGSWILSPFAALASTAAASELTGIAPRLGRLAGWGAALLGPPLAGYTAVLVTNTAVPAWHEASDEMPVLFAGSAAAAGGGAGLVISGVTGSLRENTPAARLGALGAAVELLAGRQLERALDTLPGGIADAYRSGPAGRWNRVAHALTAIGGAGALLARRSRAGAIASGLALAAGSLATRFAVFEAGRQSAAEPQHTVAPQRARLAERREHASAEGSWLAGDDATSPVPRT
ncbi:NrfD/PsrC family molybdoenzyme membrane anchor subunit [Pseudonocardia nigra]|uniref:NrfD/PsrC family molybdoenzyme membrane anchor subunit n=1 Tax=Pseudonocardia nigra TaxID=1921578 RepID=UPI001C5F76F4|nr:NrfD/PsrC family molybdoenzyme membrane anchor subunit [Pseudonocardia nigra]